jgi:hypothetical protein
MAEAPAALKKQIGPFSIGGWLLIGALGVGAGLLLRKAPIFKSKPEQPLESFDADGNPIAPAGTAWPSGTAAQSNAPSSGGGGGGGGTTAPPAKPTDNLGWSKLAIEWLIANGTPPNTADRAVRLYMEGQTLSIDEAAAISMLLRSPVGVPPEYVPPMSTGAPQVAPPAPPTPGVPANNTTAPYTKRMLVQPDDGDIAIFVSDGRTKEWVPDAHTVRALVGSGNVAAAGADSGGYPIPYKITRSTLNALAPVGPSPNYGGQASPAYTSW